MSAVLTDLAPAGDVADVERSIDALLAEREAAGVPSGAALTGVWEAIRGSSGGGKRMRPLLLLRTYRELRPAVRGGAPDVERVAAGRVAAAFELLHTAFLLHDDVIDGDTVRRGRPNLAGAMALDAVAGGVDPARATAWGQASAILAGDLLIHAALHTIATIELDGRRRRALLDLLDRCLSRTVAGEATDVALATGVLSAQLPDVLRMTRWKTAAYSFEAPLEAGAVLASAGDEVRAALAAYGRAVGVAYQLRDDVLGVFGDERVTGKSTVSDLRGGKVTALVVHARGTEHGAELDRLLAAAELTDGGAQAVRRVLVRSGARDFVEGLIADQVRSALGVLGDSPLPAALRDRLAGVARHAGERLA